MLQIGPTSSQGRMWYFAGQLMQQPSHTSGFAMAAELPVVICPAWIGQMKHCSTKSLDFLSESYLYLATSDGKFSPLQGRGQEDGSGSCERQQEAPV